MEIKYLQYGATFDSVESTDTDLNPVYTFKNVEIKNHDGPTIDLKGKYIVIADGGRHYSHFLKEHVGSYLYYKNNIDENVIPIFIDIDWRTEESKYQKISELVKDVWSMIQDESNEFVVFKNLEMYDKNIKIEELIVIFESQRIIVHPSFPVFHYESTPPITVELRKFFSKYFFKDDLSPKKIFITRRSVSRGLEEENKASVFSNRYNPEWVDDSIEDYFSSKGYKIVELSGMTIKEQINYFYNATHVAGILGTGFYNGIFSKNGTEFIAIRPNRLYDYPWHYDINDVIQASFKYINLYEKNSYQEIYSYLEEILGL